MFQPSEETRDREALEPLQLERLRRTVSRIAAHNPVYWRHLGGIAAGDLASVADLGRLPFLTKDQLRDAYPYGMACHGTEAVRQVHMSSGTTGTPIVNPYTAADLDQWREVMGRSLAAAGVTARDVLLVTASFGLFTGGFGFHFGAEALGAMVIPVGAGRTLLQLQLLKDLQATVLAAIATYPLRMIEVARQEGFDWKSTKLRVGLLGSEPWSDALRARIESEMGVRTYDLIGMTETGGPGMGIATVFTCGTITTCPRSWIPRPAASCPTASRVSSSSRRSPDRACPWSATAPTISRASAPASGARAGVPACDSTASAGGPTTW